MIITKAYRRSAKAESSLFEAWADGLQLVLKQFEDYDPAYRPLHESELASVSVLASAASRAGFATVCESYVRKGRGFGRSDLWLTSGAISYAFEFKMTYNDCGESELGALRSLALRDMYRVHCNQHDKSFGSTISSVNAPERQSIHAYYDADYTIVVTRDGLEETFIYFDKCHY